MRYVEFRKVLSEAKVGREYQHLEDLVFIEGSAGAMKAAEILKSMGNNEKDIAIKWDGNPTIYWGRGEDGRFVLVGKNGWGKNKSTNPEDLAKFIKNSGKGVEEEPWREKFGNDMAELFKVLEAATPPDYRGFVFGDLLYYQGKPFTNTDGDIQFTPNKVTYTVDKNSELGKRIAGSKAGVVVHQKYSEFGSKAGSPVDDADELNSGDVVVLAQTYVTHQPKVDTSAVNKIESMAKRNANAIDSFIEKKPGLSDVSGIIYQYMNQMSRAQKLSELEQGFFDWLNTSKVSANKQKKIAAMAEETPSALPAIFGLVTEIMKVKDDIIDQLDSADADVKASTAGEQGGEGYVSLGSKTKFVPRSRWQPN